MASPNPGQLARDATLYKALSASAYAFFLVANMNPIIWYLTPDMLLQGIVYLSPHVLFDFSCRIRPGNIQ